MFYDHFYNQLHVFDGKPFVEQCGVLFYDRQNKRLTLRMVGNSHPNPREHFRIKAYDMELLLLMMGSMHPVALFHTHVERSNPEPSSHDYEQLYGLTRVPRYRRWYGVVYNHRCRILTDYTPDGIRRQVRIIGGPSGNYVAEPWTGRED